MRSMKRESKSLKETSVIAKEFAAGLRPAANRARIIALGGDLGAGKTAFVQALAAAFGVTETITSPTFVIEKIYKLPKSEFAHLIHIDAYRIMEPQELALLGWHDIVSDPKNIVCVEWPEIVRILIPPDAISVECSFVDETTHIYEW
ncbi:MAG: tRNA (adenosine(37)-N6)-threonylcarbamoyltransferase complex ATPase subunit type 1 TsaE [Patescibacteria group bacterium]